MRTFLVLAAFLASCSAFNSNMAFSRVSSGASKVSMMARPYIMAGNWKMNTDLDSAVALAGDVAKASETSADDVSVFVCPPFPFIAPVMDAVKGSKVAVGAQDCYFEDSGAYTAAVSAGMLKSMGVEYVLAGHSERRVVFGDTNEDVNKKVLKILDAGMKAVLCIGETKPERDAGETFAVCADHLSGGLQGVTAEQMKEVVIAYEPVWAIGTGDTATPEQAQANQAYCRQWFRDNYDDAVADAIVIQYGGSVNDANVDELMGCPDIDGALVGGASLQGESFGRIANFVKV